MFTNFKNAFKKEDDTIYEIPKPILDNLNRTLPDGFKYKQIDNDICVIIPNNNNFNIKANLKFNANKVNINTSAEAIEYLYRTQQEAEIISDYIELNGNKFKIDDVLKMPLSKKSFSKSSGKLIIKPRPFPDPFILIVGYNDKSIKMKFQRQPYPSLNESLFKSIDSNSLIISYLVDEISQSMKLNISIDISKAKSTAEIVNVSNIYKSFMNGTGTIAGIEFKNGFDNHTEEAGLDSLINFWNKVHLIGKKLGIKFNPQNDILKEDSYLVNKLYRCLIENQPFRQIVDLENLEVVCSEEFDVNNFMTESYHELQILEEKSYDLFNAEFTLYELTTWYNVKVKSFEIIDKENFKYKFFMDMDADKTMFRIMNYFTNYDDAEKFRKSIPRDFAELEKIKLL